MTRTEEASEPHFMVTIFELAEDCHYILYFGLGKVNLHKVGAMLTPGITALHKIDTARIHRTLFKTTTTKNPTLPGARR